MKQKIYTIETKLTYDIIEPKSIFIKEKLIKSKDTQSRYDLIILAKSEEEAIKKYIDRQPIK